MFSLTHNPLGLHLKVIFQMNDTFVCTCRPFLLLSLPVSSRTDRLLAHKRTQTHTGKRARIRAGVISVTAAAAAAPLLHYPPTTLFFLTVPLLAAAPS